MKKILRKALPILLMALTVGLVVILLEALINITMMKTVDAMMDPEKKNLSSYVVRMLLVTFAVLPLNILLAYLKGKYKKKSMRSLKHHYLKKVFKKDIAAFDAEHSTDYVSAMTQDMTTIENGYVAGKFEVIYQGLSFFFGLAVIVYVSPWLPVLGAGLAVIVALVSIMLSKPIKKHQKKRSDLFQKYSSYIHACLSAFHIIKVNNLTDKAKKDFHHKSEVIQGQSYIIDRMNSFIFALQNFMMSSLMIGMMGAATYLTINNKMTFGGIVLVVNSIDKILGPVQMMGEWMPKISSSKVLFEKMDKQLDKDMLTEAEIGENHDTISIENSLRLDRVSFSYNLESEGEIQVFEEISLELKKGNKYLIMGPSGGGKSTLLKLLRKYHKPTDGEIYIDNLPISSLSHGSYYQMIANVEQHVFLFEDSLKDNLCLYKNYDDDSINKAIEQSGLKTLIDKLPDGLDTMIYDNGKNLSGGEKSRIAIARALLQEAQVLILDEAFSSLDDHVAKAIEKTLLALDHVMLINVSHICFDDTKDDYHQILQVAQKKIA
ncbi:MAG: ABC transporter ATP-binding protein [Clostridiales bacterium]|nr:ABC transporter ATP-binding protein [Clostridiales bacterium]